MQEIFAFLYTTSDKQCIMYNNKTDDKNLNELQDVNTHWKYDFLLEQNLKLQLD